MTLLVRKRWFALAVWLSVAPLLGSALVRGDLEAQAAPAPAAAIVPSPIMHGALFGGSLYATGDWLQANALPLNRDAIHSMSFDLSYRRSSWAVDAGYLRIARDLSTARGGFLSGSYVYRWNRITLLPFIGGFVGEALASADSTGYNFIAADGSVGHQTRYSFSKGTTIGGGAGLTAEVSLYGPIALRLDGADWFFSGDALALDRNRPVFGAGLSLRAW